MPSPLPRLLRLLGPALPLLALLLAPAAHAGDPVRLTSTIEQVEATLKSKDTVFPLALVIDKPTLTSAETLRLIDLIEGLAKKGSAVVAVCPKLAKPAAGGSAAVALSCSAVVFVDGASVVGAGPGWCLNQATVDQLKAKCAKLGAIDPLLAERLCKADADLHWSSESGFSTKPSKVALAKAGTPLTVDLALLESIAIGTESFPALEDAVAAVHGGSIAPRVTPVVDASKPKQPKKPAAPAKSDPATIQSRLQPKIAEYDQALAQLHTLQKRFYLYWIGDEGVWTTQHKSLREIWYTGADHTEHADTRTTCQRLQRDMKAAITTLRTTAADIIRIAKDPENPAVRRVNAHKEALEEFRDGIQRNKLELYEKWNKPVLDLK